MTFPNYSSIVNDSSMCYYYVVGYEIKIACISPILYISIDGNLVVPSRNRLHEYDLDLANGNHFSVANAKVHTAI